MNLLLTLGASAEGAAGTAAAGVFVVFLLIGLVFFGLWIWSLIHCVTNKQLSDSTRVIGIILIVVLGLIGSLIYLFLPRERPAVRSRLDRTRAGTRRRGVPRAQREDVRQRR